MLAVANNISTRNKRVRQAVEACNFKGRYSKEQSRIRNAYAQYIRWLAIECVDAGADIIDINVQSGYDNPAAMEFLVNSVQEAVDSQLCLSAYNIDTLTAGLKACERRPVINYISQSMEKMQDILSLAAQYNAEIILLLNEMADFRRQEDVLKTAYTMVEMANEVGLSNDRIYIDPGIAHVTQETRQRYAESLTAIIPALKQSFRSTVRTMCWIDNISVGADIAIRRSLNTMFLTMMGGLGLTSAFVDVLDDVTMRTLRLINSLSRRDVFGEVAVDTQAYVTRFTREHQLATP